MKKFNELTPDDFPGFDRQQIEDWLTVAKETNKNYLIYMGGLFLLFILISIVAQAIVFPGLLLLLIVPIFLNRKVRKMEKELHMTRKIVMMARRGELTDQTKQGSV
jgi:hypothetical protein